MAEKQKNIFSDWENVVYEGRNEIVFAEVGATFTVSVFG